MMLYELDPIDDPRWRELLLRHRDASVFHTPSWLQALRVTYGYESIAFSTSGPGQPLKNGVVFSLVKSWLTGSRMVSVPFADHCQPLVEDTADLRHLMNHIGDCSAGRDWKYVELRPLHGVDTSILPSQFAESSSFCFHQLDLSPGPEVLLRSFHKNSVLQPLRRAERERLTVEQGRSESLLHKLYNLLLLTRRRHQLPPQPLAWFQNLVARFGEDAVVWVASKEDCPVAGLLTLRCKETVVYKYGGSDGRSNHLGGTPFLLWHAIQDAKEKGAVLFDFGRSDIDNSGLITFKDRWRASRSELNYYRWARHSAAQGAQLLGMGLARRIFSALPDFCLTAAGRLLYRHIG